MGTRSAAKYFRDHRDEICTALVMVMGNQPPRARNSTAHEEWFVRFTTTVKQMVPVEEGEYLPLYHIYSKYLDFLNQHQEKSNDQ